MRDKIFDALEDFRSALRQGSKEEQFISAKQLFFSTNHKEALIAYEILSKLHIEEKSFCYFQQGECYLKMEEEEKAIDLFELALKFSYNEDLVDDAIWNACQIAYYKYREIDIIHRYKQLFPNGNSLRYANSIIENKR